MSRKVLVALVAALLALTGCAGSPGQSPSGGLPTPTIGLTYIPNIQFSPFYVAETDGLYTSAGVQPILRHHGTSEALFTAIAAGQEQFVIAGGDELMQARSQGVDLVAVASYYRSYPVEIIVAQNSPVASLADLKGRTIGIPGKYGESWFGLLVALKSAGLTQTDVKIAEIVQERDRRFKAQVDSEAWRRSISPPPHLIFDTFDRNNKRPWLITDPEDGKIPARTAEANARPRTGGTSTNQK